MYNNNAVSVLRTCSQSYWYGNNRESGEHNLMLAVKMEIYLVYCQFNAHRGITIHNLLINEHIHYIHIPAD